MTFNRSSASDQIKQLLLDRILNGFYKPGERLIELHIASEFKTSQAPVREAFRYLEALRLVETETYKGTKVRAISAKELEESSQVRAVLEELGAQLAAANLKDKVTRLEEQAKIFIKAAQDKDQSQYSKHDIEFHRIIMEESQNCLLLNIWESVVLESRFRLTVKSIGENNLEEFGNAHLPVMEALRKGDGKLAGKLLKNLICKFHFMHNNKPSI